MKIEIKIKWQDAWIGVYYNKRFDGYDIWICLIPFLPIHIWKEAAHAVWCPECGHHRHELSPCFYFNDDLSRCTCAWNSKKSWKKKLVEIFKK